MKQIREARKCTYLLKIMCSLDELVILLASENSVPPLIARR